RPRRAARLGAHRDERLPRHALRHLAGGHGPGRGRRPGNRPGLGGRQEKMIAALPDLIAKRAELQPARVALEDAASGRTLSYADLDARACRAAALMAGEGVGGGDRVAVLTRNRIEFFDLLFGCAKLGAVLVPLNWRMPPAELDGLIADCAPALLFHGAGEAAAARALAAPPPAVDFDGDYEALLAGAPVRDWPARWP